MDHSTVLRVCIMLKIHLVVTKIYSSSYCIEFQIVTFNKIYSTTFITICICVFNVVCNLICKYIPGKIFCSKKCMENKDVSRIQTIIKASKLYRDNLHLDLERNYKMNNLFKIKYHRNCVSKYTSKSNLPSCAQDKEQCDQASGCAWLDCMKNTDIL